MGVRTDDFKADYDKFPLGLPLDHDSLRHPMAIDETWAYRPPVDFGPHRFDRKVLRWLSGYFDVMTDWHYDGGSVYRRIPFSVYRKTFTVDEMFRITHLDCTTSDLKDNLESRLEYHTIWKISNSMWRWGSGDDHNLTVHYYHRLPTFDFGFPGMTTRLDMSTWCNECGYTQFTRKFIDGTFAYLIYKGDKLALTIGFTPSVHGILINQIQVAGKGNRWLYKLPCGLTDYVLDRMVEAFPETPIWLADGEAMLTRYLKQYDRLLENNKKHQADRHISSDYRASLRDEEKVIQAKIALFESEAGRRRILNVYNAKLAKFERMPPGEHSRYENHGQTFYRLTDTSGTVKPDWPHAEYTKERRRAARDVYYAESKAA